MAGSPSGGFMKKIFGMKDKTALGVGKARPSGVAMQSKEPAKPKKKPIGIFGGVAKTMGRVADKVNKDTERLKSRPKT